MISWAYLLLCATNPALREDGSDFAPRNRRLRGPERNSLKSLRATSNGFRGTKSAVSRRVRKSLKSLGREIGRFRGSICFQWFDRHFISQLSRGPCGKGNEKTIRNAAT
jgi:hypothetical protein